MSVGGEVAIDVPFARMTEASTHFLLGPRIEFGTRRASEHGSRGTRLFMEATPYAVTSRATPGVGARVGIGFTAPTLPKRAMNALTRASKKALGEGSIDDEPNVLGVFAIGIVWLAFPVWTINHVELVGELDPEQHVRAGIMVGWGI